MLTECPDCQNVLGVDEPDLCTKVVLCESCNYFEHWYHDELTFVSHGSRPMEPPPRIISQGGAS